LSIAGPQRECRDDETRLGNTQKRERKNGTQIDTHAKMSTAKARRCGRCQGIGVAVVPEGIKERK